EQRAARAAERIEAVRFEVVRPVRGRVLFPSLPAEVAAFDGDAHERAGHFGAFVSHAVAGVISTWPQAPSLLEGADLKGADLAAAWRLRGLAVDESARLMGLGLALIERALDHGARHGAVLHWATTSVLATGLWQRAGFSSFGEAHHEPGHGDWILMFARA
ncbi:MAG: GNAT superfamily N-acetyltransferase, partial [Glaciecola sp.]